MSLPDTYRDLRVLDLSAYLAGPFAAMILGDMGADVVKVERPPGVGDAVQLHRRLDAIEQSAAAC
jgi:crotonobetainyl-CoA:carnitine CoA-transferase CaiB-like acyl-CoA transferase